MSRYKAKPIKKTKTSSKARRWARHVSKRPKKTKVKKARRKIIKRTKAQAAIHRFNVKVVPNKIQRMFLHIREKALDSGRDLKEANRIASATVNRYRAKHKKLISKGGSRNQWYPSKKVKNEKFVCLTHGKKFESKAALKAHYTKSHGK